jgi:hypothetical protein
MSFTRRPAMEDHPDLAEMRTRLDRAAATPRAQLLEALALITGLYLAASAWIAGFSTFTALAINNLIMGVAFVLLLGGLGSTIERSHAMAWAAAAVGIWTIVAPWAVSGDMAHTRSITSNVIAGSVAFLLALAIAAAARIRTAPRRARTTSAAAAAGPLAGPGPDLNQL